MPNLEDCLRACTECHAVCTGMVPHCLSKGGRHADPAHISILIDCAQICGTGADFVLRESPFHARICSVCAELCEACAADCAAMADDDDMMTRCVEVCRRCAATCRDMQRMAA